MLNEGCKLRSWVGLQASCPDLLGAERGRRLRALLEELAAVTDYVEGHDDGADPADRAESAADVLEGVALIGGVGVGSWGGREGAAETGGAGKGEGLGRGRVAAGARVLTEEVTKVM